MTETPQNEAPVLGFPPELQLCQQLQIALSSMELDTVNTWLLLIRMGPVDGWPRLVSDPLPEDQSTAAMPFC